MKWVAEKRHLIALLLIAAALRPSVTSIPPQVDSIRESLGLSLTAFGFLTSIPVICFGIAAPIGISLYFRRRSTDTVIGALLIALILGTLLRPLLGSAVLFAGTFLASVAVAGLNILVPVVFKRDFGPQLTRLLPFYTVVLATFATFGAFLSIPISNHTTKDWKGGTIVWALLPILAFLSWLPMMKRQRNLNASAKLVVAKTDWKSLFSDRVSWHVTGLMMVQSTLFYSTVAWLPKTFIDWGFTATSAGAMLAFATAVSIPFSLLVPFVFGQGIDQRKPMMLVTTASLIGLLGMAFGHSAATWVWVFMLGIGQSSLPTLLIIIVLRARSVEEAGPLSAMAQGLGYLVASLGPIIVGVISRSSGGWRAAYIYLAFVCIVGLRMGYLAGKPRSTESAPQK